MFLFLGLFVIVGITRAGGPAKDNLHEGRPANGGLGGSSEKKYTPNFGGGGGQVKAIAVLDGSLSQIKVDSSRTVQDSAFFNPSYIGNIDSSYSVQNQVILMINEASTLYLKTPFSVTVKMRISYTSSKGGNDTSSVVRDFTVNYDSAHTYTTYNSRSSFVFTGAHKVTVKILSVTSNVSSWDPTKVLMIENQLITHPNFKFNCSASVTGISVNPSDSVNADELPVSWTNVLGADQYDLEWAYIDSSALVDTNALGKKKYGNPLNPALVFRNNGTRVTITGTSYAIPLIYDNTGTLFIRVRPAQLKNAGGVTAAIWSSEASTPVMGQYTFRGHQRPLNWQSNISFAEEGKRKVVLQYYDGSLRSRQTVTKDNTTNTTIIGETYYDYQGRPTIQVMPSPTLKNIIQYTAGFNVSINGAEYTQSNYDTLPATGTFCSMHADSMSNRSGASLYYSIHNPSGTLGMNQFIPDARGYPFTETEYTPDNTGRIKRQGGVGPYHQLDSGRATQYYYGTPDQNELDALFGTEVGDRSHYFKNMVRDANGQYSVNYADMHGRTIATALTGPAAYRMASLPSNQVKRTTETLTDSNSVFFQDRSMVSQKTLLVPAADTYSFNYNLSPAVLKEMNCQAQNICYTCRYDLEISITDNCNNQLLGGTPFDTVVHNFSVDSTNACSSTNRGLNFSLLLPEGSYVITKKLTANRDAYTYYRDSVYLPNNTCVTQQQFILQQKAIDAAYNPQCAPTCASCTTGVGTWSTFWANYIAKGGLSPADTAAYRKEAQTAYQNALSACSSLCKNTVAQDNDILSAMLQDVSPPYGQYADTLLAINSDKYSIFYVVPGDTTSYIPIFQLPAVQYLDVNGNPDSVYNDVSGLMVTPNSLTTTQFVANFRPSWANALLPYHPEYCKLQVLQAHHTSNLWDRQMESIDDYQTALTQGYLNPTGNGSIAPATISSAIVTANIDPLSQESSSLKNALEAKLKKYEPGKGGNPDLNMWAISCVMVMCDSGDARCPILYGTPSNNVVFNSGNMCPGELDMAWRNFRQLYLNSKGFIFNQQLLVNPAGCVPANNRVYTKAPTTEEIYTSKYHHQPQFGNVNDILNRDSLKIFAVDNNPANAAQIVAQGKVTLDSFRIQNCRAFAKQWMQQLSVCTYYSTTELNNIILPALMTLCYKASDSAHPYGASSLPQGMTITVSGLPCSSFKDIIDHYNQSHSITDVLHCNSDLITSPLPYGNQPVYSNKPVYSRPSDCECGLINDLYNRFRVSGGTDANFAAFLKRTQQITMSQTDLDQLRNMCANTTNSSTCRYLSNPIMLPPAMQCFSGPGCATCTAIDSLYHVYLQQYPADTPSIKSDVDTAQAEKNRLFQNFMNNRLGFNMQTWEYLNFRDTCASHSADTATTSSCLPRTIAHLFRSGGTDGMTDIRATPDGGVIMAGQTTASGIGGKDAYLIRYDSAGNIQWARTYGSARDDDFNKVRVTSDKGFVAVGTTYAPSATQGSVLIVRTDAAGNTLWQKAIGFTGSTGEKGFDIIQTKDGGYAAVGDHGINYSNVGTAQELVIKLDSVGNVSWIRGISAKPSGSNDAYAIAESNDTLLVTGRYYVGPRFNGTLYKISESTGTLLGSAFFLDSLNSVFSGRNMSCSMSDLYLTNTGYRIYAYNHYAAVSDSGRALLINVSYSGKVLGCTKFDAPPGNTKLDPVNTVHILPTSDNGYLVGETGAKTQHINWLKFNSANLKQWSIQTQLTDTQFLGSMVQNPNGTYTVLGTDKRMAMLLNLSDSGKTGCYDNAVNISGVSMAIDTTIFSVNTYSTLTASTINGSLTVSSVTITDSLITCPGTSPCYPVYNGPLLCGKSAPIIPTIPIDSITTCSDSTFFSVSKGTALFKTYSDSLIGDFEVRYNKTCLQAYKYEAFTVTHNQNEYHYTLYYYDQAGNLVKTIPPAGVQQNTDTNWIKLVRAARASKSALTPPHTLVTQYRYNSLNQVVSQKSPDGGTSNFWYDRLGRLALSQNLRQKPNNQYSFTQYDSIGRIVQVGQLVSSTAITDSISRIEAALALWKNNAMSTADQITVTNYDSLDFTIVPELAAHNLRSRVSWTALFNTNADRIAVPANHAAATYYSYDILGNVDTLVQDFNQGSMGSHNNRFKKLVYDYDLVSGKVNQVTYQHGYNDAFYHSYLYDAENRITNVQSSTDSVNWDNDAYYSYYAHGPLARTVLGQQQVQGVNYAYTLQGWLKSINPAPYTGGAYTLRPDSSSNIVAATTYNLLLNYFNGDFAPISGTAGPDNGVSASLTGDYRPLYNGNISSMGLSVRGLNNPLLYNYQYDQLNRLVRMDAWNRTSASWSAISKVSDFQENIAYDPNGNILKYKRNGNNTFDSKPIGMDSLNYSYIAGTNKLDHINDSVPTGNYGTDIDNQSSGNYKYDSIGNLVSDVASNIGSISWNVYGKIASITKSNSDTVIQFTYDPSGNRISKSVTSGGNTLTTWYVRDAQGNVLSVYTFGDPAVHGRELTQTELHIYGSSRLGILKTNNNVQTLPIPTVDTIRLLGSWDSLTFIRGNKLFELSNHLGNVVSTISDKHFGHTSDGTNVVYYTPDVVSANDYYPFGSLQPGGSRSFTQGGAGNYRYGFNGQEKSDEIKGSGNSYTAAFWEYDPRVGIRWNTDPKPTVGISPYSVFNGNPVLNADPLGDSTGDPLMPRHPIKSASDIGYWPYNAIGTIVNGGQSLLSKAGDYVSALTSGTPLQSVGAQVTNDYSAVSGAINNEIHYYQKTPNAQIAADTKAFFTNPDNYFNASEQVFGILATGKSAIGSGSSFFKINVAEKFSLKTAEVTASTTKALVSLTEETFSQALFTGAEKIGEYSIYGTKGMVGTTFNRNIFLIETTKKGLMNFRSLIGSMEAEAVKAGAEKISIYGSSIINKGFLNPTIAKRFGYSFEQSGSGSILQKTLK